MNESIYAGINEPLVQGENTYIPRLLEKISGPMNVIGCMAVPPRDGRPAPKVIDPLGDLLEKTSTVRRPRERMLEFISRTGLGAAQMRTMTRDQIAHFVEVASQNEQPPVPRGTLRLPREQQLNVV